jgi:hypothetical protein
MSEKNVVLEKERERAMEPVMRHEVVSDNVPGLGRYGYKYSSHQ